MKKLKRRKTEEVIEGIEGLGEWGINLIISKLDPNDTAIVSCVSKKFQVWASDDVIWAFHCSNDLNLSSPVDPFGNTVPSFKVRASAVFVPEHSDLQTSRFMFAYSVRMSLLPEGCTIHGMTFNSCEHYMRHWIIRENETVTSDIIGEAIIGKFPLLVAGEKEFGYECRTLQETNQGSIEGSCTFVPGRLDSPEGGPFKVEIGRFELIMPDYIF